MKNIELKKINYKQFIGYKENKFLSFTNLIDMYNDFVYEIIVLTKNEEKITYKSRFCTSVVYNYKIISPILNKSVYLPFLIDKINEFEKENNNIKFLCDYYFLFDKIKENILTLYKEKDYRVILDLNYD